MKKKLLIAISFIILAFTVNGCLGVESATNLTTEGTTQEITTEEPTTEESTTEEPTTYIEEQWDAYFPSYDNYDSEIFVYATVFIWFNYDTSSAGNTIEEKREFYLTNNQAYYDELELGSLNNDDIYMSIFSTLVILTYRTKVALFEDFSELQNIYATDKVFQPSIELNTVAKTYKLTLEDTIDDLIEITDQYFNTEITFASIPVTQLDIFAGDYNDESGILVIGSYDDYMLLFPENDYDLTELYFDDYDLIVITTSNSGSVHFGQVSDAYFFNEDTFEIVVTATSSTITTTDLVATVIVLAIEKNVIGQSTNIRLHIDKYYPDGAYADRPFYNTVD